MIAMATISAPAESPSFHRSQILGHTFMLRKLQPYLVLLLIGGGGVFAWRNMHMPLTAPASAAAAPSVSTHPVPATPNRLDFLSDIGQPYQARIIQLRNTFASECSEPEIRNLYQLLEKSPPKGELAEHWYVIANDIMGTLLTHETDAQRFATNFTRLLNDAQQPDVMRDYAVQYLVAWLNPRAGQTTAAASAAAMPTPEIAAQVLQSLAAATTDPALEQSTVPGTTLMMLVDLTRSGSAVDCRAAISTLTPWLARALQDGSPLSNPIRVSAVSAAGILDPDKFRPSIRKIAYQDNGTPALRLPAIAAMGQAGDATDLPKLQEIAANSPDLSYAARDAASALTTRLAPAVSPSLSK
jgi:hypothetical protein